MSGTTRLPVVKARRSVHGLARSPSARNHERIAGSSTGLSGASCARGSPGVSVASGTIRELCTFQRGHARCLPQPFQMGSESMGDVDRRRVLGNIYVQPSSAPSRAKPARMARLVEGPCRVGHEDVTVVTPTASELSLIH